MHIPETLNLAYIDTQYQRYKSDPNSVSRDWQIFFKGFDIGLTRTDGPAPGGDASSGKQSQVAALIHRYRDIGHLLACMDPLSACPTEHPLLSLEAFGLSPDDYSTVFATPEFNHLPQASLKDIVALCKKTYCRSIGVEYMHLQDPGERGWLQDRMEPAGNEPGLDAGQRRRVLDKLVAAALFEQFLNKKYVGVTRFSLEGGDGIVPMLDALIRRLAHHGGREVIIGMAHRGRLNVQANILQRPFEEIFAEFESCYDSGQLVGAGDVKYHNGYLARLDAGVDEPVQALLVNNPSHLEAVDPVVEGVARARQDVLGENGTRQVAAILLHGDAAFAGQGIVAETLNMSQLAGYRTGGTVHVVINNQIGYTTLPEDARSTRYATDVAKMLMVPVFHVHGENPEALVHVARLAADYRHTFAKDVVIDVVCYRRFGHNEGDEPYFTQPMMYEQIRRRPAPFQLYADQLIGDGLLTSKKLAETRETIEAALNQAFDEVHGSACPFPEPRFFDVWGGRDGPYSHEPVPTGLPADAVKDLARRLCRVPDGFSPHPKVKLLIKRRLTAVEKGAGIDWANAESLAFASLVTGKTAIRLSGQDVGRGTFSQRHSVWFDKKNGSVHVPLNHLGDDQAPYQAFNSLLAEASVMGFEYGYAMTRPEVLTLWEAQFGDFANNAQAIIDLFVASGQAKWQRPCGLVLLLPHGWEGLGPEHSSARLERFLQLCADDNMQVCYPSTPAQYFHLLRRQMLGGFRKPLVVMTPKSLLRHPMAVSALADLSDGHFWPVIDDPQPPAAADRVIVCSGKIYYQLVQRRDQIRTENTAIVRLEQFFPFPEKVLTDVLASYRSAGTWLWVQEEPRNMGGWQFVRDPIEAIIGKRLGYVGRKPAASPATGFPMIYKQEQEAISDQAVGPLAEPAGMVG